jgi:hypothetical protein
MSLTYSVRGVGDGDTAFTTATPALRKAVSGVWELGPKTHDVDKGLFEATYHLRESGRDYPVHLVVQSRVTGDETYNKVEFRTWVEIYDDVSEETEYQPNTFFLAWRHAGKTQYAVLDALNAFRFLIGQMHADTGTPATANAIRKLNDGNADILNNVYSDAASN